MPGLARSEAVSATATGQLHLTKAGKPDALLQGRIQLPETRYQIIRQGSAQVPELTGVRFKTPRRQRFTTDEPKSRRPACSATSASTLQLSAPNGSSSRAWASSPNGARIST
jgi:translocation and assembly module TamB